MHKHQNKAQWDLYRDHAIIKPSKASNPWELRDYKPIKTGITLPMSERVLAQQSNAMLRLQLREIKRKLGEDCVEDPLVAEKRKLASLRQHLQAMESIAADIAVIHKERRTPKARGESAASERQRIREQRARDAWAKDGWR